MILLQRELLLKILDGVIYDLDKKIKGKRNSDDVALKEKIENLRKTLR